MKMKTTAIIFRNDAADGDKKWVLEWPAPQGHTLHRTIAEAKATARKNGMAPVRCAGCDAGTSK